MALTRRSLLIATPALLLAGCTSVGTTTISGPLPPVIAASPAEMAAAINALRRSNGQAPLSFNDTLADAARRQARLMAERDQLSHNFGAGLSLRERVTAVGFTGPVGENVAGGQRNLDQVLAGWMASGGHRSTLLSDRWSSFGMAMVPGRAGSRYGAFWAAVFGG